MRRLVESGPLSRRLLIAEIVATASASGRLGEVSGDDLKNSVDCVIPVTGIVGGPEQSCLCVEYPICASCCMTGDWSEMTE